MNKGVEYYYNTNRVDERVVYRKDYLMYNQAILVTCFGVARGELICQNPGSELRVSICQDAGNGTEPKGLDYFVTLIISV